MTTFIESTDGVRVALHDLGGNGPPLLILHATGFHGRCYSAIAEELHDNFHVWAPDLRGHGDSVTPDEMPLPWAGMVDDTLAVIDHLGVESVAAVGHSMGGATVVATALRRPGVITGGWLFEPIIFPAAPGPTSVNNPMAEAARRRRHEFASFDEVIERYSARTLFHDVTRRVMRDYVIHGFHETEGGVTLKATGEQEARVFEGIDASIFDRLQTLDTRLTVVGSTDGDNPAQMSSRIAHELPHGTSVTWEGRTHFGPFEDPGRAGREILEALA